MLARLSDFLRPVALEQLDSTYSYSLQMRAAGANPFWLSADLKLSNTMMTAPETSEINVDEWDVHWLLKLEPLGGFPGPPPEYYVSLVLLILSLGSIVLPVMIVASCATFVAILKSLRHELNPGWAAKRAEREKNAVIFHETLMLLTQDESTAGRPQPIDVDPATSQITFVFTDIQGSTIASHADAATNQYVQSVHDHIMRESINAFNGYEIHTQGDAFEIAFTDAVDAIKFALHVQSQLYSIEWKPEVYALPECGLAYGPDGSVVLRGPRIRIGVHTAAAGEWSRHFHALTLHEMFSGDGYKVAARVADSAHGGQTLITSAVLEPLLLGMGAAGFPIIEHVGSFTGFAPLIRGPVELFHVQSSDLSLMPHRHFDSPPRGLEIQTKGTGMAVVKPPVAASFDVSKPPLAFAFVHFPAPHGAFDAATELVYSELANSALQTSGYISSVSLPEKNAAFVFKSMANAAAFAVCAQMAFLLADWPSSVLALCGETVLLPDGRRALCGVRASIAVHMSADWEMTHKDNSLPALVTFGATAAGTRAAFTGRALEHAADIARCAHGGQIVLSQAACEALAKVPRGTHFMDLGVHRLHDDSEPQVLKELVIRCAAGMRAGGRVLCEKVRVSCGVWQVCMHCLCLPSTGASAWRRAWVRCNVG
jgi:class 3 adenylate cyclase